MKRRITLTIEPKVSMRAKNFAQRRGVSVSALVEQLLVEATSSNAESRTSVASKASFSARWAGQVGLAKKNDPRTRRLRMKYGLEAGQ